MADELESAAAIDAGLAHDLRAVGVHDLRELRAVGAAEAWERLLAADLRDTLASRLALEAAETGRRPRLLDPEVRERCAAHVRRRLAPEPPGAPGRASFTVAPPRPSAAQERADRRRTRIVAAAIAVPIAVLVVLWLLFG